MEATISEIIKGLRTTYIVQSIFLILIIIFNFILLSQIIWLKNIFKNLYLYATILSPIHFIMPIISLIYILSKKITKKNVIFFKIFSLIFCAIALIFGFFFIGILMINAIESPEFCKECPFNLPIQDINAIINSKNLNEKCNERRCVTNSNNIDILEKNENDMYEYLCNYDPTSEFEEFKETYDNSNNNKNDKNDNNTNNEDNIYCTELIKNIEPAGLQNNYIYDFYDKCTTYSNFYMCERTKTPNKFNIERNFVCPEKKYLTKLIALCLVNIIFNLILNFIPIKIEYDKFKEIIKTYHPRAVIPKSNSFNSTINSSKIQKNHNNPETEEKFERTPTEILIICNNKNNNIIKNNEQNINKINNIENEIENNNIIIQKSKSKKIKLTEVPNINTEKNERKIKASNSTINIRKNINNINNIKLTKKEKETIDEDISNKKLSKFREESEGKVNLSFNDTISISTKRNILPSKNNKNSDI